MTDTGSIRAGIGGWTFAPWRGTFYPDKLRQKDELEFASRQVTTIEINGTYYGTQKPATFARWANDVPEGFVFSVKGNRFVTNRRVLAESGDSLERFLGSGITELGDHLGPLLWQFAPTKKFDADDFGTFLSMLPKNRDGLDLRHAVEVRHPSFCTPQFVSLTQSYDVAIVYAHHQKYPEIADVSAPFVYARLQEGHDDIPTAYSVTDIDTWAKRARNWAEGENCADLLLSAPERKLEKQPRDVFVYFIHEGKIRAPQAAMAMQQRCDQ